MAPPPPSDSEDEHFDSVADDDGDDDDDETPRDDDDDINSDQVSVESDDDSPTLTSASMTNSDDDDGEDLFSAATSSDDDDEAARARRRFASDDDDVATFVRAARIWAVDAFLNGRRRARAGTGFDDVAVDDTGDVTDGAYETTVRALLDEYGDDDDDESDDALEALLEAARACEAVPRDVEALVSATKQALVRFVYEMLRGAYSFALTPSADATGTSCLSGAPVREARTLEVFRAWPNDDDDGTTDGVERFVVDVSEARVVRALFALANARELVQRRVLDECAPDAGSIADAVAAVPDTLYAAMAREHCAAATVVMGAYE